MTQTIRVSEKPLPGFIRDRAPTGMLIGGDWTQAASGETFETVNPATGSVLATVASGGPADVDRAVAAARRAFEKPSWASMNPHDRTLVLLRIADAVEANAEELAALESLDGGIPITVTRGMVADAAKTIRYYAGWPTKILGTVNPVDASVHCYTVREPVGVCAGIIPWNGPLVMAVWKIAPALACGNTVVLKPAEQTPLTALRFGQILTETGLPPGVVNIVTGFGETAGAAISAHPGIDKVSFTGSTATGKLILAASVGNLKRVTLELGGKSPHIIMPDADIGAAARTAAAGFAMLTGQVCVAGTRILVHESVMDEFAEELAKAVSAFRVGDPFDEATMLGPVVSAEQFERVNSYVTLGVSEGADVVFGGGRFDNAGYFVEPTVFGGVNNDMRLAREEIFGPVAALIPFGEVDEAVRIANDTDYGLAAAVATTSVSTAHSLARRLRAGVVWVNTYSELDPTFPFGGYKQSGIGRELGDKSLESFTELKSVFIRL
ncbi:MAG TPA: aldehyde dehydrogenase family protein [Trebonia sp.]|nr:aldehyde dehydrogenase family protein [Trebonia sp.]